jgi:uncharacterized DUF497 family protein
MEEFDWNDEKDEELRKNRGISFEDIVIHIENGNIIDVIEHPDKERYPNQKIVILDIDGYAYMVPYVTSGKTKFLKTIIPSRKATKKYLRKDKNG